MAKHFYLGRINLFWGYRRSVQETGKSPFQLNHSIGRDVICCHVGVEFLFWSNDSANFRPVNDPAQPNKYKKVIYSNHMLSPIKQYILLIHEMSHGCLAHMHTKNKDTWKASVKHLEHWNKSTPKKKGLSNSDWKKKQKELEQKEKASYKEYLFAAVIDELRAYGSEYEGLIELARLNPPLACNTYISPSLIPGVYDAVTGADIILGLIKSGEFARKLIKIYVTRETYPPEVVYETEADGKTVRRDNQGRPIIKNELIQRIRKAGYSFK